MDFQGSRREIPVTTIWIDNLSILSLRAIFKIAFREKIAKIRFVRSDWLSGVVMKVVKILRLIPIESERIVSYMGDMWTGNESAAMTFIHDLPSLSHCMLLKFKERRIYKILCRIFSEEKLDVFF